MTAVLAAAAAAAAEQRGASDENQALCGARSLLQTGHLHGPVCSRESSEGILQGFEGLVGLAVTSAGGP